MTRYIRLSVLPLVLLALFSSAVLATDEANHRYNVRGFVLDENENPVAGSAVSIRLGNQVIGYQKTNSQGYYAIQVHLHDSDLGRRLGVRTAAGEATVRVTFAPGDRSTARIHYVNLVGGKLVEKRLSRSAFPMWVYVAVGAAVIVLTAAMMIGKRIKRKRKREQAKARKHKKKRKRR